MGANQPADTDSKPSGSFFSEQRACLETVPVPRSAHGRAPANARLVLVPVVRVRVVRMRVLERFVYMNVRVRFLIVHTIRVLMLMMLIVDVPVFVHKG
jgi:hypothetical protein